MIKYKIFKTENGISCRITRSDRSIAYMPYEEEFERLLDHFKASGYKVKTEGADVYLCRQKEVIILKNYEDIIKERLLHGLKDHIERTIKKDGVINLDARKKVNRVPNKKKSSDVVKKTVVGAVAISLVLSIAFGNMTLIKDKDEEIVQVDSSIQLDNFDGSFESIGSFSNISTYDKVNPLNNEVDKSILAVEPDTKDLANESAIEEFNSGYLEFEDLSNTDKANYAKEEYYSLFEDAAKSYGLDADLLLAIGTQERGVHSIEIDDGKGIGLMQIQYPVWIDKDLTYYKLNEETGVYEKDTIHITDELLKDLDMNINIGAMILQDCLIRTGYNIPASIQMYNQGLGSIRTIIKTYCEVTGKDYYSVLEDPEDLGWLDYRYLKAGDPEYLENVNKWAEDNTFTVKNVLTNEDISYSFVSSLGEPSI